MQCDEPERLYKRPRTRFVADFFRDCNVLRVSPLRGANKTPIYRLAGTLIGAAAADGAATGGASYRHPSRKTFTLVLMPRSDRFAFPAFLSKSTYRGTVLEYLVELGDGQRLVATTTRHVPVSRGAQSPSASIADAVVPLED